MKKREPVCVCMATYNGIKYIKKQVESILTQLLDCDELLISDDGSTDGTFEYIEELSYNDSRIKVIDGPHHGVNANFFYLIEEADKEIIFISDQDDIWSNNKIDRVCDIFTENNEIQVVLHKDTIYYEKENREEDCNALRHGVMRNLLKNSYSGHRMAFRKKFRTFIIKDLDNCPAYDMYLGLLAEKHKCSYFLEECLDKHIMHGTNATKNLSVKNKILIRWKLLLCLLKS